MVQFDCYMVVGVSPPLLYHLLTLLFLWVLHTNAGVECFVKAVTPWLQPLIGLEQPVQGVPICLIDWLANISPIVFFTEIRALRDVTFDTETGNSS